MPTRYAEIPLAKHRYIPGETAPHLEPLPIHKLARQMTHENPELFTDAKKWRNNDLYLHGVDCFNFGFWWESHEAWEYAWNAAGRKSPMGLFLQGLIQVSAAHIKAHTGKWPSCKKLLLAAEFKIQKSVSSIDPTAKIFLGLNHQGLLIWLKTNSNLPQNELEKTFFKTPLGLNLSL